MKKTCLAIIFVSLSTTIVAEDQNQNGKELVNKYCGTCHTAGVANAPKTHDQTAWKTRIDVAIKTLPKNQNGTQQIKDQAEKAMEALVINVKKGLKAMPPGGMCPPKQCSDQDYKDAIKFMMSQKSNK